MQRDAAKVPRHKNTSYRAASGLSDHVGAAYARLTGGPSVAASRSHREDIYFEESIALISDMAGEATGAASKPIEETGVQPVKAETRDARVSTDDIEMKAAPTEEPSGVAEVEAAQVVWGKRGWYTIWFGYVSFILPRSLFC